MEDVVKALRTVQELKTHPYPDNIFTSCFYLFEPGSEPQRPSSSTDSTLTVPWKEVRATFDIAHLRPCHFVSRDNRGGHTLFTVQIRNRPRTKYRVPNIHVVTGVPRHAIQFADKMYTTDQLLKNAFRHPMGLDVN